MNINYKFFKFTFRILKYKANNIYKTLQTLPITNKFSVYLIICINHGDLKGLYKDNRNLYNGLFILITFRHSSSTDRLKLSKLKRTIRINNNDLLFFNRKHLWYRVEKFKEKCYSVILYCHNSYFGLKLYDMKMGEAKKIIL
ncbi:hypothetical protein ABK040_000020 [Willaertia magna]